MGNRVDTDCGPRISGDSPRADMLLPVGEPGFIHSPLELSFLERPQDTALLTRDNLNVLLGE